MEHIPLPNAPRFTSIDFPYRGIIYDGENFFDYPARCDFDVHKRFSGMALPPKPASGSLHSNTAVTAFQISSYYIFTKDDPSSSISPKRTKEEDVDALSQEFLQFYHTWFYFGMMHTFLTKLTKFNQGDFLRRSEDSYDTQYICTSKLQDYLNEWYRELKSQFGNPGQEAEFMDYILPRLAILEYVQEMMLQLDFYFEAYDQPEEKVSLSIRLLGEALTRTIIFVLQRFQENVEERGVSVHLSDETTLHQLLDNTKRRLYRWVNGGDFSEECFIAGWCPSDIKKFSWATPSVRCYMAAVKLSGKVERHKKCSQVKCIANNIDEKTYKPAHIDSNCACALIGPVENDLHRVLDEKQIPTILFSLDDDENVTLSVATTQIAQEDDNGYIAISHVWSDGRGNSQSNSLPTCQLIAIAKMCKRILPKKTNRAEHTDKRARKNSFHFHFWIDTLCIPRNDLNYRSLAIQKIDEVFKEASSTLVLDGDMLSAKYATPEETMVRLALSGWNRRAWTLQEALTAGDQQLMIALDHGNAIYPCYQNRGRLYHKHYSGLGTDEDYVICHGIFTFGCAEENKRDHNTLSQLIDEYQAAVKPTESNTNGLINFSPLEIVDGVSETYIARQDLLAEIWVELSYRSTTRDEDYPIVIATLFGLPLKAILQKKGLAERMRILYSMFSEVAIEVVFGTGKRLPFENWRWAPATVDEGSWGPTEMDQYRAANITENGLIFNADGILFEDGVFPTEPVFNINMSEKFDENVEPERSHQGIFSILIQALQDGSSDIVDNEEWAQFCSEIQSEGLKRLGIIVHNLVGDPLRTLLSRGDCEGDETNSLAVIVAIKSIKEGVIQCVRGRRARMIRVTSEQIETILEIQRTRLGHDVIISDAVLKGTKPTRVDELPRDLRIQAEIIVRNPNEPLEIQENDPQKNDEYTILEVKKVIQQKWCLG